MPPLQLMEVVGVAILIAELALVVGKRSNPARDKSLDRRSLRVLWIACLGGVAAAYVVWRMGLGPWFHLGLVGERCAIAIILAGFAFRLWAVRSLGPLFTVDVAIREGHELVTKGPYGFVRHPAYTGLLTMFVGWSLTFQSVTAIAALLVPFLLALLYRVRVEESALAGAFGPAYDEYRKRTKRLIPFVY